MTASALIAITALGLTAGLLIGCIGVGGVIIVPALVQVGGFPVYTAISVSMAGYILTGLVGSWVYFREGTLNWPLARLLCVGAMPAAVGGALVARITPPTVLELIIALLTAASGIQTLFRKPPKTEGQPIPSLSKARGTWIGTVTGFVSSLTGTGGPTVLIPLLLWFDLPILMVVGLAQTIQLPIAAFATIGNAASGTIDPILSLALGIGLTVGALFGARIAHRLHGLVLRRLVALMLLAVGLSLIARILRGLL